MTELPDGIVAVLQSAEVDTVGKICDWSKTGRPLTEIPKIGAAKATKIEEALDAFWKRWANRTK